jgi:hypothetical protein
MLIVRFNIKKKKQGSEKLIYIVHDQRREVDQGKEQSRATLEDLVSRHFPSHGNKITCNAIASSQQVGLFDSTCKQDRAIC